jgi:hypothetical protein
MARNGAISYRSPSRLALCASLFFVAEAIVAALAAFSTANAIELLDEARFAVEIPARRIEAADSRQFLFACLQMSVGLMAGLVFLVWVYRANRNARDLGADGMRYGPGWSVGWFFVPIASLFMPYLVMREIWKASSPSANGQWRRTSVSPILGVWWGVMAFHACLHYEPTKILLGHWKLGQFLGKQFEELNRSWFNSMLDYLWGLLAWDVMSVCGSLLSLVVVISITQIQERNWMANVELDSLEPAGFHSEDSYS